jgi:hypothetical protein
MRPDPDSLHDPRLEAHLGVLRGRLSPTAVALAQQIARSLDWRALGSPQDPRWTPLLVQHISGRVAQGARSAGLGGDAGTEALVFLVLMQAAKSAQEDLKAIMNGVKAINAAKEKIRDRLLLMVAQSRGPLVQSPPR